MENNFDGKESLFELENTHTPMKCGYYSVHDQELEKKELGKAPLIEYC